MKIGLITTLHTNIGDDFIREGIVRLLKTIYSEKKLEFICVNKHRPYTVYPSWYTAFLRIFVDHLPIRKHRFEKMFNFMLANLGLSRFENCDLIIQCGAPVFWPNCSRNEWAKPLWHDVIGRLCNKVPVLNLAAGACYPWEKRRDILFSKEDAKYITSILGYCRLTTVRDHLARSICMSLGRDIPLIPCSAFLAGLGRRSVIDGSKYILINYMQGAGHYEWGQDIQPKIWEKTVERLIARLGARHRLAFLCHDEKEYVLSKKLDSHLSCFFPKSLEEYFECVSGAKFGICNRMHATVGMAGVGIPSIAVCTDTRLLMIAELGLPIFYVKDVNVDILEEETEHSLKVLDQEYDRLFTLQQETWNKYLSVIGDVVFSNH